jgi:hypothetical protein
MQRRNQYAENTEHTKKRFSMVSLEGQEKGTKAGQGQAIPLYL